jgi:hypothetical protein
MTSHKVLAIESATILDASGVHSGKWDQALKQVAAGLSKEESRPSAAFAVMVYGHKHVEHRPNYLAAAKTFAIAYQRALAAISRIKGGELSSPQEGHFRTIEPEAHIRIFVGEASAKDIKQLVQPSPGIFIMASHLDASFLAELALPQFPEQFRDLPLVLQVEDSYPMAEDNGAIVLSGFAEGIGKSTAVSDPEAVVERDTLGWRMRFISRYPQWTSAQIAQESSSLAKNQPSTASRWTKDRRVFAIDFQGQKRFPRFQFQDGKPIPAVSEVLKVFPEHASGWDLAYFFTTPNANVSGRRPFELLKADPSRVVSLARAFVHPADVF